MTTLDSPNTGSPSWSPDGANIAFDSRVEGHADIFVVSASGGSPRRLTKEPFENQIPSWSRDGRWVYFSSDRSGRWQIWKVPASGGPAVQVTAHGGFNAFESLAEGVETTSQRERLIAFGCELAQGFLFAKPIEREAARALLAEQQQQGVAAA